MELSAVSVGVLAVTIQPSKTLLERLRVILPILHDIFVKILAYSACVWNMYVPAMNVYQLAAHAVPCHRLSISLSVDDIFIPQSDSISQYVRN